jgi:hypothetical protein
LWKADAAGRSNGTVVKAEGTSGMAVNTSSVNASTCGTGIDVEGEAQIRIIEGVKAFYVPGTVHRLGYM